MKKPNWTEFNYKLYSWTVYQKKFNGIVHKYSNKSHAINIGYNQILDRIYERYNFYEFKQARELVRRYKDEYGILYEKWK